MWRPNLLARSTLVLAATVGLSTLRVSAAPALYVDCGQLPACQWRLFCYNYSPPTPYELTCSGFDELGNLVFCGSICVSNCAYAAAQCRLAFP